MSVDDAPSAAFSGIEVPPKRESAVNVKAGREKPD